MKESTLFWSRFLAAYLSESSTDPVVDGINDWSAVIERGNQSHVLEMIDVFKAKKGQHSGFHFPESLVKAARKARTRTVHRNSLFGELIEEFDRVSEGSEVRYAWLKGAVRLRQESRTRGERRLSDLDVLVHPDDIRGCHNLLVDLGYEAHRDPDWITSRTFSKSIASTFYTRDYRGTSVLIDLHWHLIDYPARRHCGQWDFSLGPIWERITGRTMAPEHRLIYLIDHAFTHNFTYWKVLTDLHELLTSHQLDWGFVRRELNRMNLGFVVALFNSFTAAFFRGLEKPSTLDRIQQQSSDCSTLYDHEKAYVNRTVDADCAESDYLKICLRRLPGLSRKLSFLRYIVFPPVEAVPMVRSDSGPLKTVELYVERFGRVLKRGLSEIG